MHVEKPSAADTGRDDHEPAPGAVCTLPTRARTERLAWIREAILPHVVATERLADGMAFEMETAPGLAATLDHWVGLERACCASLGFERVASRTPGRLRLEVRGVDPEGNFLRSLGLAGTLPRGEARRARLAGAAGAGVLGIVVCCLLPVLAGAVLGAGAAPLAALDSPVPIVLAASLGAGGAWWWRGRRTGSGRADDAEAGPRAAGSCGPDC